MISRFCFCPQDNIEAVCEIITIIGLTMATSTTANTKKFLDGYMARLEKLAKVGCESFCSSSLFPSFPRQRRSV
jgi:hypothetical protein